MPVLFDEDASSPVFQIRADRSSARRVGRIAWGDTPQLVADMFPPTIVGGSTITVGIGAPFPGWDWLRASAIQVEPYPECPTGPDTSQDIESIPDYKMALVTIDYESINFPIEEPSDGDPVPFLTHRWSLGGEFLTLESHQLEWCDEEKVPDHTTGGVLVPIIEHEVHWPRVINPPFSAMRSRLGKVNDADFQLATGTAQQETLLFLGAELKRDVMSNGARAWDLTYRFSERRVSPKEDTCDELEVGGWNHFWRDDGCSRVNNTGNAKAGWYRMQKMCGSDRHIYQLASFDELFQAEV